MYTENPDFTSDGVLTFKVYDPETGFRNWDICAPELDRFLARYTTLAEIRNWRFGMQKKYDVPAGANFIRKNVHL
jgi:hypothetical protein